MDPDNKVYGANIGSTWGRQDPGGPHVGPMNFVIGGVMHAAGMMHGFMRGCGMMYRVMKDWIYAVNLVFVLTISICIISYTTGHEYRSG